MSIRGPQVCRVARISYRQLGYWDRLGVCSPSVMAANGSGSQRLYCEQDVRVLFVLGRLVERGIGPTGDIARAVAVHVRARGIEGALRFGVVVIDLNALEDPFALHARSA